MKDGSIGDNVLLCPRYYNNRQRDGPLEVSTAKTGCSLKSNLPYKVKKAGAIKSHYFIHHCQESLWTDASFEKMKLFGRKDSTASERVSKDPRPAMRNLVCPNKFP